MKQYILFVIGGFLWCLGVNAQVGIKTSDLHFEENHKMLKISGDLRVGVVSSAVTTKTVDYETSDGRIEKREEKDFSTENYDRVLVANKDGEVGYVKTGDFHAFNLRTPQYRTRTLPYKLVGTYDREVVEGSIFSIDWLDLCVQYIGNDNLEVKFRPNDQGRDSNGLYEPFLVNTQVSVEQRSEQSYFHKLINPNNETGTESMQKWFYASHYRPGGESSKTNVRLPKKPNRNENIKIYRMFFQRKNPEENLQIIVYLTVFERSIRGAAPKPYLTISLYITKPNYVGI